MAIGDILVKVGADISQYKNNMFQAADIAGTVGGSIAGLGASVSATFAGIAVASAAGLYKVVDTASSFEDAFTGVRKVLDGTEEDFSQLETGIRGLAKEIPLTTEEIAGIAEKAGQLGIAKEDIIDFTEVMAMMGTATNMSAEEASTSLARFANITGMSMDDVDRLGSTVVDLGNNLATTESEIVQMAMRLAGAGTQIGLTESEILALSGSLSSLGIRAESGGTALSKVFLEMQTAVMDAGGDLDKFSEAAGMSAKDFANAFEDDASGAIVSFVEGLDDIGESGGNVAGVLDELGLGEIRVRDALMRMANGHEIMSDALDVGKNAWEENNALVDEAEQRYSTFSSQVKIMGNRIKDFFLIAGKPLLELWTDIIKSFDPVLTYLEGLARKFENLSDGTKRVIAVLATLVPILSLVGVAIGGVIFVLGAVIGGISGLIAGAAALSEILIPVAAIVAVVAAGLALLASGAVAAVSAVIALWKESEVFRDKMSSAFEKAVEVSKEALEGFWDYMKRLGKVFSDFWNEEGEGIVKSLEKIFTAFYELGRVLYVQLYPIIKKVFGFIADVSVLALKNLMDEIMVIVDIVNGDWRSAFERIGNIIKRVAEEIGIDFDGLVEKFKNFKDKVDNNVIQPIKDIKEWFEDLSNTIETIVDNSLASFEEGVENYISEPIKNTLDTLSEWKEKFQEVFEYIRNDPEAALEELSVILEEYLEKRIDEVIEKFDEWKEAFTNFFEGIPELAEEKLSAFWETMGGWFEKVTEMIPEKLSEWWTSIGEWFSDAREKISDRLDGWWTSISEWFGKVASKMPTSLSEWWTVIRDWFTDTRDRFTGKLDEWWDKIKTWFKNLPNKVEIFNTGAEMIDKVGEGNESKRAEFENKLGSLIVDVALAALAIAAVTLISVGMEIIDRIATGVIDQKDKLLSGIGNVISSIPGKVNEFFGDMVDVGKNIVSGLINGVKQMADRVATAASNVVGNAVAAAKAKLNINSPSKVFEGIGINTGEGFIVGMLDESRNVRRAAEEMVDASLVDSPNLKLAYDSPEGLNSAVTQSVSGTVDIDTRDDAVIRSIERLERRMSDLTIEMDGREVGVLVEPHVSEARDRRDIRRSRSRG